MREYFNKKCGCCGESFGKDDDIAVCPECGTPIHRKCWNGHCPNEHLHAEGFDWDKAVSETKQEADEKSEKRCAICGGAFTGDDDIVFCEECGTPTHRHCREELGHCPNISRHGSIDESSAVPPELLRLEASGFEEFIRNIQSQEKESGVEHTCYGVKHMEMVHFLGVNNFSTPRFYSLFFNMADTGRKVSFNFMAGLLMPFYQYYRKMTGPSVVLSLAVLLLEFPQAVLMWMYWTKNHISAEMMVSSELYTLVEIFSYVYLALRIAIILFNDYIYMRWSVGKILDLRERYRDATEAEYMEALERAGKPKFTSLAIGATVFLTLSYVVLGIASSMGMFS